MNFTTLDLTREHSSRRSAELGFGTVESILTLTFSSSSPRGTSYSWSQREDFLLLSSDGGHFLRLETSVFQLNGSPQLSSPASSKSSKINYKNSIFNNSNVIGPNASSWTGCEWSAPS